MTEYICRFISAMEDQQKKLVTGLLAYAVQRDISPAELCRLAAISDAALQDPQRPLTQNQLNGLWEHAVGLSRDACFGLHFGESLQLAALGVVGEMIRCSATVGAALMNASSFIRLLFPHFSMTITHGEKTFSIHFNCAEPEGQNTGTIRQILDLLMAFVIHEMDGLMLKKIRPIRVHCSAHIKETREYERVMRCAITKSEIDNSISFDRMFWDEPVSTANYELQAWALAKMLPFLPVANMPVMHNRIYNYLLSNSYLGLVSLEDISANFNLSSRTIQRKLKEEGVSFQGIADEVRKILAINYLKNDAVPVKEISYILGYNELSAFTRSFKRWTGMTPVRYQKQLRGALVSSA